MSNGWLRVDARLTRTGVFVYKNADGTERRELRRDEDVFDSASLESFSLVPLTNDHPPGLLDASNAKQFAVGSVGELVRRDGQFVTASILVMDAATITAMEGGKRELSCGYSCDLEETPGVFEGQRYDAIQKNIRGNHVALVTRGRAGSEARVHLDSDAAEMAESPAERTTMRKIRIDGIEVEVGDDTAVLVERQQKAHADSLAAAKAEADKSAARADAEKARADAAEKARADAAAALPAQVRARVALEVTARKHLGESVRLDEMTDRQIKVAVVEKLDGVKVSDERSDAYVEGGYDAALEHAAKASPALDALRTVVDGHAPRTDAAPVDEAAARRAMIERNNNAWKMAGKE
jgi:hypothetical protein